MTSREVGLLGWVVLAGSAVTLQLLARAGHRRVPTLREALDAVVSLPLARWALLLVWVAIGLHLFVWPPTPGPWAPPGAVTSLPGRSAPSGGPDPRAAVVVRTGATSAPTTFD